MLPDCGDAFLPANTATRGNGTETLRGLDLHSCAVGECDRHDILPVSRGSRARKIRDLIWPLNHSLGHEKARREFFVIAGRPHRRCDGLRAYPNLKWFLNC